MERALASNAGPHVVHGERHVAHRYARLVNDRAQDGGRAVQGGSSVPCPRASFESTRTVDGVGDRQILPKEPRIDLLLVEQLLARHGSALEDFFVDMAVACPEKNGALRPVPESADTGTDPRASRAASHSGWNAPWWTATAASNL